MEDKEKTVSVASLRALSPVLTRTWEGHLREGVGQEGGGFAVSTHSAGARLCREPEPLLLFGHVTMTSLYTMPQLTYSL